MCKIRSRRYLRFVYIGARNLSRYNLNYNTFGLHCLLNHFFTDTTAPVNKNFIIFFNLKHCWFQPNVTTSTFKNE